MTRQQEVLELRRAEVFQLEESNPGWLELAKAYLDVGTMLEDVKELEEARSCYEKALEIYQDA